MEELQMQSYKLFITLITLTFLTMGCGEKNPYHKAAKDDLVEVVTQDTEDIRNDTSTDNKEKAKRLAKIGELLLETPRGAELAAEIFEEALSFDQENDADVIAMIAASLPQKPWETLSRIF